MIISAIFNSSSANALNFDLYKSLSFSIELNRLSAHGFICFFFKIPFYSCLDFKVLTCNPFPNFRLFQAQSLQTTISNLMKIVESSPNRLRGISPFPTVFQKKLYCRHVKKDQGLFGKGLINSLPHNFNALQIYTCRKPCEKKEKVLVTISLFSRFLPYVALIFQFKCTLKCNLQFVSIWTGLKFCRLVMD